MKTQVWHLTSLHLASLHLASLHLISPVQLLSTKTKNKSKKDVYLVYVRQGSTPSGSRFLLCLG